MTRVFIDGSAGTTGLRIRERLAARGDIELIALPEEKRKDAEARREALNSADVAFLCLPDDAARESVGLVENGKTAVIDTSTAHRTSPGWAYGLPELYGRREEIARSKRVANPGCHATGFIVLIEPLLRAGLLRKDTALTAFSLTGYTGGGKKMIAEYEDPNREAKYSAPRQYGLTQAHKHLPEMVKICGLETAPVFCPIVADFPQGMEVTVPVFASDLRGSIEDVKELYREIYPGPVIRFTEAADPDGMAAANALAGKDSLEITVSGNNDRILLISRFDNLGKGASGAAIQNMNIITGLDETTGLELT